MKDVCAILVGVVFGFMLIYIFPFQKSNPKQQDLAVLKLSALNSDLAVNLNNIELLKKEVSGLKSKVFMEKCRLSGLRDKLVKMNLAEWRITDSSGGVEFIVLKPKGISPEGVAAREKFIEMFWGTIEKDKSE